MIWTPVTQPAASVMLHELSDGEIEGLLHLLDHEQARREGKRPTFSPLAKAAFQVMLHSRHPGHIAKLKMFARTPRAASASARADRISRASAAARPTASKNCGEAFLHELWHNSVLLYLVAKT
jgi:hypothetical protein